MRLRDIRLRPDSAIALTGLIAVACVAWLYTARMAVLMGDSGARALARGITGTTTGMSMPMTGHVGLMMLAVMWTR